MCHANKAYRYICTQSAYIYNITYYIYIYVVNVYTSRPAAAEMTRLYCLWERMHCDVYINWLCTVRVYNIIMYICEYLYNVCIYYILYRYSCVPSPPPPRWGDRRRHLLNSRPTGEGHSEHEFEYARGPPVKLLYIYVYYTYIIIFASGSRCILLLCGRSKILYTYMI